MKNLAEFDRRPVVVAVAGPPGAGKTAFYYAHLAAAGLRLVHGDDLMRELQADPLEGPKVVDALRRALLQKGESFVARVSLWDPAEAQLGFLKDAAKAGYTTLLCFVGLESAELCEERVAMRTSQGGVDVPAEKIPPRYARTILALKSAVREIPRVLIYDNSDPAHPFRLAVAIEGGRCVERAKELPAWVLNHLFAKRPAAAEAATAAAAKSPKGKLSISVRRRPQGRAVLKLEGSVDPSTFKQVESAFRWFDKQGIRFVAVDMALLTYISSAAFSLLIKVKTDYAKEGGDVVLVRPQTPIINIMRVLGLMDLFRIASSPEEALLAPGAGEGV